MVRTAAMKKTIPLLFILFSINSLVALGEQNAEALKRYSRSDDDKDYTYSTAKLNVGLHLKKVAAGFDAQVSFTATLTTAEAQGFAESVRFGMRESERSLVENGKEARAIATNPAFVQFKFLQGAGNGTRPDTATQRSAEALSNQAFQTRQLVPGNRPEAMGKTLGGTLSLGVLSEGDHQGTIFVQQVVGQTPSATDADISVRHLIRWHAKVENGKVYVEVQNGKYYASDIAVEIAAPSWDGTIRPHRVTLRDDRIILDGKIFPSGTAQYGSEYADKGETLMTNDREEFRREYNFRERAAIRRGQKR
jgi:hypothetical protein